MANDALFLCQNICGLTPNWALSNVGPFKVGVWGHPQELMTTCGNYNQVEILVKVTPNEMIQTYLFYVVYTAGNAYVEIEYEIRQRNIRTI